MTESEYIPADHSLSVEQRARQLAHAALDALARVIDPEHCAKDADVIKAADAILDRGHGKPTQAVISVPARVASRAALAALSTTELLAAIGEARLKSRPGYTGRSQIVEASRRLETAQHSTNDKESPSHSITRSAVSEGVTRDVTRDMLAATGTAVIDLNYDPLPPPQKGPRHHRDFQEGPPAIKWEFDEELDPLAL